MSTNKKSKNRPWHHDKRWQCPKCSVAKRCSMSMYKTLHDQRAAATMTSANKKWIKWLCPSVSRVTASLMVINEAGDFDGGWTWRAMTHRKMIEYLSMYMSLHGQWRRHWRQECVKVNQAITSLCTASHRGNGSDQWGRRISPLCRLGAECHVRKGCTMSPHPRLFMKMLHGDDDMSQ